MLPDLDPEKWGSQEGIHAASQHLLGLAVDLGPSDVLNKLRWNPAEAIASIPGVTVKVDQTSRSGVCQIDGTYDSETATITYRQVKDERDRFTLLHELGHHLLAQDERWWYDIRPLLDKMRYGFRVEERIVSDFAARVLIPDEEANAAFARGVTAESVVRLYEGSPASASACLVRALAEPGERLVILADHHGEVRFALSSGSPYAPDRTVNQPALEATAQRALDSPDGTFRGMGLGPIRYASGRTFANVHYDVAVHGHLLFAIVTAMPRDRRLDPDPGRWSLDCERGCGEYTPNESAGFCNQCQQHRCPRCRGCACTAAANRTCAGCFTELPVARLQIGLCEDCE